MSANEGTPRFDWVIDQGADFNFQFNWYGNGVFMAPIEDIREGYPTRIKVTGHGLPSISDTPVIISGVEGCEPLNSVDRGIARMSYVDADWFDCPQSTVNKDWINNTGEITYNKPSLLTDWTARMQLRRRWHDVDFLHEATTENGGITLTGDDGGIAIYLHRDVTRTFVFAKAFYDIELIDSLGTVVRVLEGTVRLAREISR